MSFRSLKNGRKFGSDKFGRLNFRVNSAILMVSVATCEPVGNGGWEC